MLPNKMRPYEDVERVSLICTTSAALSSHVHIWAWGREKERESRVIEYLAKGHRELCISSVKTEMHQNII
jgi:hypothetical protein